MQNVQNLIVIDYTPIFILRICETSTSREKCSYLELFWYAISRIWTEYGEILRIFPYLVRMQENEDENNTEYRHSLRSGTP